MPPTNNIEKMLEYLDAAKIKSINIIASTFWYHEPPKSKPEVTIEHMTRSEVDVAIEWARKEGWNPGVHDAECFYQADPTGFYAAKLDGEIVGTISLVKYPGDFVFEGLYIVKPEFRGKGIGLQLQNYALNAMQ